MDVRLALFDRVAADLDRLAQRHTRGRWLAEGYDALQLPRLSPGDFGYTSAGTWRRVNLIAAARNARKTTPAEVSVDEAKRR